MSVLFDPREAAIAAIVHYYRTALPTHWHVALGWVGNAPLPDSNPSLTFEIAADDKDDLPAFIVSVDDPAPDDPPIATAKVQFARLNLNIAANLYIYSQHQGKTLRSDSIRRIHQVLPINIGAARALILQPPAVPNILHLEHLTTELIDDPDSIRRNEWRAIMRFRASMSLTQQVALPYCRTIATGTDPDQLVPVDHVLDSQN
jgi:hypothetical protein